MCGACIAVVNAFADTRVVVLFEFAIAGVFECIVFVVWTDRAVHDAVRTLTLTNITIHGNLLQQMLYQSVDHGEGTKSKFKWGVEGDAGCCERRLDDCCAGLHAD